MSSDNALYEKNTTVATSVNLLAKTIIFPIMAGTFITLLPINFFVIMVQAIGGVKMHDRYLIGQELFADKNYKTHGGVFNFIDKQTDKIKNRPIKKFNTFTKQELKEFKCCICFNKKNPVPLHGDNRHAVCKKCVVLIDKCPICRKIITNTQN